MSLQELEETYKKLYPNFKPKEFECKCSYSDCPKHGVEFYLLSKLQELRNTLRFPLNINSGFRCEKHNQDIGGKKGSYHLKGLAADISLKGISFENRHRLLKNTMLNFRGIGVYKSFIHMDLRDKTNKSLWIG